MGKVMDIKCPSCSATLHFNSKIGKMKCEYCGSEFTAEDLEKPKEENFDKKDEYKENTNINFVSYNCPDCGAEIVADEATSATFCLYCGSTAILKDKLSGKFKPDLIIPFKTEKQQAIDEFIKLRKGRPLMPKSFNDSKNIEKIRGLYVPFWLYNTTVEGGIKAKGTKVQTWTIGDTHYTKTDYYNLVREGSSSYTRIPTDGSTRFDNNIMNTIEPFDYKELVKFNPAYLSGFLAEKYDVDSEEAFKEAGSRAINSAKEIMLNDMIGYGSKSVIENTLAAKMDSYEYALLPVWMVNVKYNDNFYLFAMNGQTGEFVGNIPLDKKKAVIHFVCAFVIAFLIFLLISYFLFLGGVH